MPLVLKVPSFHIRPAGITTPAVWPNDMIDSLDDSSTAPGSLFKTSIGWKPLLPTFIMTAEAGIALHLHSMKKRSRERASRRTRWQLGRAVLGDEKSWHIIFSLTLLWKVTNSQKCLYFKLMSSQDSAVDPYLQIRLLSLYQTLSNLQILLIASSFYFDFWITLPQLFLNGRQSSGSEKRREVTRSGWTTRTLHSELSVGNIRMMIHLIFFFYFTPHSIIQSPFLLSFLCSALLSSILLFSLVSFYLASFSAFSKNERLYGRLHYGTL